MPADRATPGPLVVAVLTYKRPDDLPELLPMLVQQARNADDDAWVLVVDNDAEGSASKVVAQVRASLPVEQRDALHDVVEPEVGIAAARNRALDEAAGAHLLAFIDDDERPEEGWLATLLACHAEHDAAGVAGAVVPDVGRIDDPWIRDGEFFVRKRHATGAALEAASTANLLLDLRRIEELGGIRFDPEFSLTGGSDTMFTRELVQRGGRLVWCDEAVVVDHIRTARLTRSWVLQRHFRAGNGWTRIAVKLAGNPAARLVMRLRCTLLGVVRIVLGGARAAYGRVRRSYRHQARGSRTVARGVGMVSGAWGVQYVEYRRVKGS